MDPDLWEEPESFRPERFLTEEGKLHKPAHFMPFAAGQRMCLGDKIAEMELQLFFTSLLPPSPLRLSSSLPAQGAGVAAAKNILET